MSILQKMVSTLFQRAIQTFKEYGATDEDVVNAVREAKETFKKINLPDRDRVDEILSSLDNEVSKLDTKKD